MDGFTYALFSTPINGKIITKLQDQKKKVILIPKVETQKTVLCELEKIALLNAAIYDWIIFTDIFTVDFFIEFLEENNFDLFDLDAVRICAFGEAVADKLRFSAIHSDIIATSIATEKIFESIKNYLGSEDFSGLKFLILKDFSTQSDLGNSIKKANSEVQEISLYQIYEKENTEISKIKALILGGAIDEFIFSDPADFVAFKKYFSHSTNQNDFSDIKFSAFNEIMFQMLFENGFHPTFFSPN
jgi:uroporphyrinogen-III synthase